MTLPGATSGSILARSWRWIRALSKVRVHVIRALMINNFLVLRSYRAAFGFELVLGGINVLTYFFISRTFANTATADLGPAPNYFSYAIVGLAVSNVVGAASIALAVRLREEQLTGTLEAVTTRPVRATEMAIGWSALAFLGALVRAAAYLLFAIVFLNLDVSNANWPGFVLVLLATAGALSSVGVVTGAITMLVKRAEAVSGMIIFGLGLVSGAYFPISVLPEWLQPLGAIAPTRFAFDGLRDALFAGGNWENDLLVLLAFGVLLLPLAMFFFSLSLRIAKRLGSLAEY
jgi:ABC-2 type transport system permease protein